MHTLIIHTVTSPSPTKISSSCCKAPWSLDSGTWPAPPHRTVPLKPCKVPRTRYTTPSGPPPRRSWGPKSQNTAQMQLRVPLHYGGPGICQPKALHRAIACLSVNALSETAITEAPEHLQPLSSPLCQHFAAIWSNARQVVQTVEPYTNAQLYAAMSKAFLQGLSVCILQRRPTPPTKPCWPLRTPPPLRARCLSHVSIALAAELQRPS
jgi:hypothetical protein